MTKSTEELTVLYRIVLASNKGAPLSYSDTLKFDPTVLRKLFQENQVCTQSYKFNRVFVHPSPGAPQLHQIVPPDQPNPVWNTWSIEMVEKANIAYRAGSDVVAVAVIIQRPINEVKARMEDWYGINNACERRF